MNPRENQASAPSGRAANQQRTTQSRKTEKSRVKRLDRDGEGREEGEGGEGGDGKGGDDGDDGDDEDGGDDGDDEDDDDEDAKEEGIDEAFSDESGPDGRRDISRGKSFPSHSIALFFFPVFFLVLPSF